MHRRWGRERNTHRYKRRETDKGRVVPKGTEVERRTSKQERQAAETLRDGGDREQVETEGGRGGQK